MRIKLKEGKQRELIELAKEDKSWPELSKELGVVDGYLRNELRNEQRLLSDKVYNRLARIVGKDYDRYIIERLKDNWGRFKGGKLSPSRTKDIEFPEDSVELAEFYGIMLGNGNLIKMKAYKIGTYQIRVVGDSRHDKDYLINYVKLLIEKLFSIEVHYFKSKNQNALNLVVTSRKLTEFLEEKGFEPGNKIKNDITIPQWIKRDKNLLKACLRGLYDTDGGIYKLNNQSCVQIVFTNYNLNLLNNVRKSLLSLGIRVSNVTKNNKLYITKKSELGKFLKQIGFRNFKHLDKVKMWNL